MNFSFTSSGDNGSRLILQVGYALAMGLLFVTLLTAIAGQMSPAPEGESPFAYGPPQTQELCEAQGGAWTKDIIIDGPASPQGGYCSGPLHAEKEWQDQRDQYNQAVRLSLIAGAAVAALAALLLRSFPTLAASLLLGAIFSLYANTRFDLPAAPIEEQSHVIILAVAWLVLAYIGRTVFPSQK